MVARSDVVPQVAWAAARTSATTAVAGAEAVEAGWKEEVSATAEASAAEETLEGSKREATPLRVTRACTDRGHRACRA